MGTPVLNFNRQISKKTRKNTQIYYFIIFLIPIILNRLAH